jgi:hypothetical protein
MMEVRSIWVSCLAAALSRPDFAAARFDEAPEHCVEWRAERLGAHAIDSSR